MNSPTYPATLLLIGALSFGSAPAQELTVQERERALAYLDETRNGVTAAVQGLSEKQWTFKPAADRWSAAEIVEHLALIEGLVQGILGTLAQAPPPGSDHNTKEIDEMILAKVPDRSSKVASPPQAIPTGRWAPSEALEHFLAARIQTTNALPSTPELRQHVVKHPVLGPLDGYQWILAVAAHSARHTQQILEVEADPRFPAKQVSTARSGNGY